MEAYELSNFPLCLAATLLLVVDDSDGDAYDDERRDDYAHGTLGWIRNHSARGNRASKEA